MVRSRRRRRRYPKNWKLIAYACKEHAKWLCEECHEANLTVKVSKRTGLCYKMRLHAAHVGSCTDQPRLKALCPACHARLDAKHRRREVHIRLERLKHLRILVAQLA
jgi:hypothetical protein